MFVVVYAGICPLRGPVAVGFPFTPLAVGLFGLMGRLGPFGMPVGLLGTPVGLFGLNAPGVPVTPAEGVVPEPEGAVVAPVEGDVVPAAAPPAAVWAATGKAAIESVQKSSGMIFIPQSRSQFC